MPTNARTATSTAPCRACAGLPWISHTSDTITIGDGAFCGFGVRIITGSHDIRKGGCDDLAFANAFSIPFSQALNSVR
jgi:hypothetical protein